MYNKAKFKIESGKLKMSFNARCWMNYYQLTIYSQQLSVLRESKNPTLHQSTSELQIFWKCWNGVFVHNLLPTTLCSSWCCS